MTETTAFTVDTDDEYLPDIRDIIASDDSEELVTQRPSCCARVCRRTARPLSVQSGDIIWPAAQRQSEEEVPKSGFYDLVFPILHKIVRVLFFKENLPITAYFAFAFFITTLAVLFAIVVVPLRPSVNLSIRSFQIPDQKSSIHWDGYQAAIAGDFSSPESNPNNVKKNIKKSYAHSNLFDFYRRSSQLKSTSPDCPTYPDAQSKSNRYWFMDIVYKVPKGETLLTVERIKYMHAIEEHIYNNENYPKFCPKIIYKTVCDPVSSLLTYLYPRYSDGSYMYPDNDGLIPETEIWQKLIIDDPRALWYTGGYIGANYSVELLRAQVRIGFPLPCYATLTQDEQHKIVTDFLLSLTPDLKKSSRKDLQVLYGGTDVFDYEVDQAIYHDLRLVGISAFLVLLLVFILTGASTFMLVAALLIIISCFPLAYLFYRMLQYETLSILSLISPFVIIGIGVDDIFVFLNTFKQSQGLRGLDTVHKRLTHTIIVAGKATFFTSLTTAVAFFANMISSIPAVKQFGIFMGLIVLMCFVQVFVYMPFVLHFWHCHILPCENSIFQCLYRVFCLYCLRPRPDFSTFPAVRYRDLEDDDSGIDILEQGNGSTDSENSSTASGGSGTSESDSNLAVSESNSKPINGDAKSEDQDRLLEMQPLQDEQPLDTSTCVNQDDDNNPIRTVERKVTVLVQTFLLQYLARPVMVLRLWKPKRFSKRQWALISFGLVWLLYLGVKGIAVSRTCFLQLTDRPPQFFNPDSNIQKMLDLTGNLTESSIGGGAIPLPSTPPPATTSPSQTSATTPTRPTSATTHPTTETSPPTSGTTPPTSKTTTPTSETTPPTSKTTTPTSETTPPTSKTPPTTETSTPPTTQPDTPSDSPSTPVPTLPPPPASGPVTSSDFTNNIKISVVFGIKGVKRTYSTSHLLPSDEEGDLAELDPAFNANFSCPQKSGFVSLKGTIRALCRLCANITDPVNGLVLDRNAQCLPSPSSKFSTLLYCWGISSINQLSECQGVHSKGGYVNPHISNEDGRRTMKYYAMTFLSTTSPSASPFENHNDYLRWEDFISKEMAEIKEQSDPGELYEGAYDILSSAYQTSKQWVEINTELVAIYGSIYGVIISCILCSIVVVILSHNWRLVFSMTATIAGIIITLLGLFQILGWRLGIIEAISLSILVGNSLDYCIHLTEGYMSADSRHFAFLDKFKFAAGASIRVKRVMAAMSFIGVSIISSAITTILATLPMLGTQIQLFTRFGEILLLDTFVAIVYTMVFCSNFLGFIGPVHSKYRVLNAVLTIGSTFLFYGVLFLVLYGVSKRVDIPSPDGGLLFG